MDSVSGVWHTHHEERASGIEGPYPPSPALVPDYGLQCPVSDVIFLESELAELSQLIVCFAWDHTGSKQSQVLYVWFTV